MSVIETITSFFYEWPLWEKLLNFTYNRIGSFFEKFNAYFQQRNEKQSFIMKDAFNY